MTPKAPACQCLCSQTSYGREAYLSHSPDEKIKAPRVLSSAVTGSMARELS